MYKMYILCTLCAVELVCIDENVNIFTPFMLIQIQRFFMCDGQSQVKINFIKKKEIVNIQIIKRTREKRMINILWVKPYRAPRLTVMEFEIL